MTLPNPQDETSGEDGDLKQKSALRDGIETVDALMFLVIGLVAGSLAAVSVVETWASEYRQIVATVGALVAGAIATLLAIYFSRHRIAAKMKGSANARLGDIVEPTANALLAASAGNLAKTKKEVVELGRVVLSWYAWVQTRRWLAGLVLSAAAIFASIAGMALLSAQNELLKTQNDLIEEQGRLLRELQEASSGETKDRFNRERRTDALDKLFSQACATVSGEYRCSSKWPIRLRLAAARDLAEIEKAAGRVLNLQNVDLQGATIDFSLENALLDSADLRDVRFIGDASLRSASLQVANLSGAQLGGIDLVAANLEGVVAVEAYFDSADLRGATLDFALLVASDFSGAKLDGVSCRRCSFYRSKLSKASFVGALMKTDSRWLLDMEGIKLDGSLWWDVYRDVRPTSHIAALRESLYCQSPWSTSLRFVDREWVQFKADLADPSTNFVCGELEFWIPASNEKARRARVTRQKSSKTCVERFTAVRKALIAEQPRLASSVSTAAPKWLADSERVWYSTRGFASLEQIEGNLCWTGPSADR